MHNIDWNLVGLFVFLVFVQGGAVLAYWHVIFTHHARNRRYNPQEARLFDLMRAQETTPSRRVRRALGSRAVLPPEWKESQTR